MKLSTNTNVEPVPDVEQFQGQYVAEEETEPEEDPGQEENMNMKSQWRMKLKKVQQLMQNVAVMMDQRRTAAVKSMVRMTLTSSPNQRYKAYSKD